MTKLSKYFDLDEMCATSHGPNKPSTAQIAALTTLCVNLLDPIRDQFGPVIVNSGFRSPAVNKAVGGSSTSDHLKGMAADIVLPSQDLIQIGGWICDNMDFKQLIFEAFDGRQCRWLHVSFDPADNRKEVLTMVKINGKTTYKAGRPSV
jgi:hypothetical protein